MSVVLALQHNLQLLVEIDVLQLRVTPEHYVLRVDVELLGFKSIPRHSALLYLHTEASVLLLEAHLLQCGLVRLYDIGDCEEELWLLHPLKLRRELVILWDLQETPCTFIDTN